MMPFTLEDPMLGLAADVLDDFERIRIANENRLRQLTRGVLDKDEVLRGFGLTIEHKDVQALVGMVATLNCKSPLLTELGWERPTKQRGVMCCLEHEAENNLTRKMKENPLGDFVERTKGMGFKQGARFLARIGDPYIRPEMVDENDKVVEPERPRLMHELRSYCGFGDPEKQVRQKGVRITWDPVAKMRVWLIAGKQVQTPGSTYRWLYDETRVKYADAKHDKPCRRCGPSGKPAQEGSPLSLGHQHARGIRKVAQRLIDDTWREAQRLHIEHG